MQLSNDEAVTEDESVAIALLRQKDVRGLEVLVHLYQLRALRMAFLIVGSRDVAEDVVADAFIVAFERIHQYDPKRPFAPWFYRIVVNLALKWLRRNRRHSPWETAEERPCNSLQPDDIAERNESLYAVRAALWRLSGEQRTTVVLRFYMDLEEREIAALMNVPLGTVKWRLHRARKTLREVLRQWEEAGERRFLRTDLRQHEKANDSRPFPQPRSTR
ncbi:MAG: RNA polymerase subunit sigma-24 [Candidatus Roseilinea sp.]|nr:MAG: RNA polymerase subunit sigma-24 [Candidatus Roseilinea sp.]GIV84946.1 MAG: RNA polymerase subunit sigma-24 [Candidatus Roseilinea sp.]